MNGSTVLRVTPRRTLARVLALLTPLSVGTACLPAAPDPAQEPPAAVVATADVRVSPPPAATGGATGPTLPAPGDLEGPPAALKGQTWTLTGFAADSTVTDVLPGQEPSLVFSDAGVAGNTGCNSLSARLAEAEAAAQEGRLRFGPLGVTRMACTEAERNAQEARFLQVLEQVARYRLVDAQALVLEDAEGRQGLLFSSAPPSP